MHFISEIMTELDCQGARS